MSDKTNPTKRDIGSLRFEVIRNRNDNKAICEGNLREVVSYLKKRGPEGLRVMGVDIDSFSSMEPMPAKRFLQWYDLIVLPQLKSANYSSDLEFYFPDDQMKILEEDK